LHRIAGTTRQSRPTAALADKDGTAASRCCPRACPIVLAKKVTNRRVATARLFLLRSDARG